MKAYDAARPSYPVKVIRAVRHAIGGRNPLVLDIGCGTGISARQVARSGATVIGCDIDEVMLRTAMRHREKNVAYVLAAADKLPFRSGTFDAVTAFQSLHWFDDKRSLRELRRVLKKGRVLFVVNPKRTGRKDLRELIGAHVPHVRSPAYSLRDFTSALKDAGFTVSVSFSGKSTDTYSLKDFLTLVQSLSLWNQIPERKKNFTLRVVRNYYSGFLKKGRVHDTYQVQVLAARK